MFCMAPPFHAPKSPLGRLAPGPADKCPSHDRLSPRLARGERNMSTLDGCPGASSELPFPATRHQSLRFSQGTCTSPNAASFSFDKTVLLDRCPYLWHRALASCLDCPSCPRASAGAGLDKCLGTGFVVGEIGSAGPVLFPAPPACYRLSPHHDGWLDQHPVCLVAR